MGEAAGPVVGSWLGGSAPDDASRQGEAVEVLQVDDVGVVAVLAACIDAPKEQDAVVRQQGGRMASPLQPGTCTPSSPPV